MAPDGDEVATSVDELDSVIVALLEVVRGSEGETETVWELEATVVSVRDTLTVEEATTDPDGVFVQATEGESLLTVRACVRDEYCEFVKGGIEAVGALGVSEYVPVLV